MEKIKSADVGESDYAEIIKQACGLSKNAVVLESENSAIAQNVILIWLNNKIDENNEEYQHIITQLQCVVNFVKTFTDVDQCIDFLMNIYNKKVFIIISDELCQNTVPFIHDIVQIDSIFIFCSNKTTCEQWTKEWFKIKDVFTKISPLCDALEQAIQQYQQNAISISFVETNGDVHTKNLDQLDASFMYTQIFKEILLSIEFEEKHFKEFIDYCRVDNEGKSNNVNELEREYHDRTPIWWYTSKSFLYVMVNCAFRLLDINSIIKMGCFVRDIHRDIEQLHKEQFGDQHLNNSFVVSRGQGLSKECFDQMMKTKGGLMSFNSFLSTSKDLAVSLSYAQSNRDNPDLVGIQFVMKIDPSKSSTPFASISHVSHYKEENEVLFSMHTVFRIDDIKSIDGDDRLFRVDLTLTSDDDKDLRELTEWIRKETFLATPGWDRVGLLLLRMGQFEQAHQVYQTILQQANNDIDKGLAYNQLGVVKHRQGKFREALTYYKKSLDVCRKVFPLNDPRLVDCCRNIFRVYADMGKRSEALSFYRDTLEIQQQSLPPNHPYLASSNSDIASLYCDMGKYSEALSNYEKELEISKQLLPKNHPDLASSYNNIGTVYSSMCEFSKAVWYFEKALEIRKQSLHSDHYEFASSYHNIGEMYQNAGEYQKAVLYLEKALEIQQKSSLTNHPDFAASHVSIGCLYDKMGEHAKALSMLKKALEIYQETLPSYHPSFASLYNNIGEVNRNVGEYSKALSCYEKALEIQQQSLPTNHSDFALIYINIGSLYGQMGEHLKALPMFEKALEIYQKTLSSGHLYFAEVFGKIGLVYLNTNEKSKGSPYFEKALEIYETKVPTNRPNLFDFYNNIGEAYTDLCGYSKALLFYKKALDFQQHSSALNHTDLVKSYNNIAATHSNMGEYSTAVLYYEKSLHICQAIFSLDHPHLILCYNNVGNAYREMDKYSLAVSYYKKALHICQKTFSDNHPYLMLFYNNVGNTYRKIGNYSKALSYYERAIAIGQYSLPSEDPHLQTCRKNFEDMKAKL